MTSSMAPADVRLRVALGVGALAITLGALMLASMTLGRYPVPLATIAEILWNAATGRTDADPSTAATVVLMVRLPRIIVAVMVGAGLSVAGAAYQTIFRNPMASPALLGVSAGAGFGASIALLSRQPPLVVQAAAFCGGLTAVIVVFLANRVIGGRSIVTLVLCGMVVSALFQALISMVKYVADPVEVLATIAFWLMGSLAKANGADAIAVFVPVLACGAILWANRWRISLLALGEHEAATLGVDVARMRMLVIVCATLMSAATVCVAGIVGWVGLLIPHIARAAFGMEPGRLTLATALLGAVFLLFVDDLARSISIVEVPLGVLTALIGAPFFLFLLMRSRQGQWA